MYNICILANNTTYFDVEIRNFPDIEKAHFIVVNETRYNPCEEQLREILERNNCSYDLINSKEVCKFVFNEFKKHGLNLTDSGKQFFKEYRMGMKVLLLYYVLTKYEGDIWFCDDDCIFLPGWEKLFESEVPNFHKAPFVNYFGRGHEYTEFFLDLASCDETAWKKRYLLNGHYLLNRNWFDMEELLNMTLTLFNSEVCYKWWKKYIEGKNIGRGWFLDMNWFNAVIHRLLDVKELKLGSLCELAWIGKKGREEISKPGKKKVFIHYAVRNKPKYIELAIKEKIIK